MRTYGIIGFALLLTIWMWLAWMLLAAGGITLKNLLILAMSAIIVFVPLIRKLSNRQNNDRTK